MPSNAGMPVSLFPLSDEGPKVSITTTLPQTQNPQVLDSRVAHATYALGDTGPSESEINADFWTGNEDRLRQQTLLQENINERKRRIGIVGQIATNAAKENRSLSAAEQQYLMGINSEELKANDKTILERLYAKRYTQENEVPDLDVDRQEAETEAPSKAPEIRNAAEDLLTKQQIAQRVLQDTQDKQAQASWAEIGVDFAKGLVPFYSWWQRHDRIQNTGTNSFFLGENVEQQIRGLYLLPPEEFETRLREAVDATGQENILEAAALAQAAVEYSTTDSAMDTLFTGLDAVDVATLGAGAVVKSMTKAGKYARRLRSTVQANATVGDKAARQAAQGNLTAAATTKAQKRINALVPTGNQINTPSSVAQGATRPQAQIDDLMKSVPGLLDPQHYRADIGSLSNEAANRLVDDLSWNRDLLTSSMTDVSHLGRISESAFQKGVAQATDRFKRNYSKLEDAIVDIRPVRESQDIFSGVDRIDVFLGKKDASSFSSEQNALFHAQKMYRLPEGSYDIVDEGGNFFIRMSKTIDETDPAVQDIRIQTDNATPVNFQNMWTGLLRNANNLVSKENRMSRLVATYGGNAVMGRMTEAAKTIGQLGKRELSDLNSVIDDARFAWRNVTLPDGSTQRVQGKFYDTFGDLEKAYMTKFNRRPSEKEQAAYFTFRELMDFDYVHRNLSVYRDKARLGLEQKSIGVSVPVEGTDKYVYRNTEFFEGRDLDALPDANTGTYGVGWIDPKTGRASFGLSDRMFPSQRAKLKAALDSGDFKVIQVADNKSEALRNLFNTKGEPIEYLVVRDVKSKPLSFQQVAYNEGGHWAYPQTGFYLKQPNAHKTAFGRRIYDGDTTAHYFPTSEEGRKFADAYNHVREMLINNAPTADIDAFVRANLPYGSAKEVSRLFRGVKGASADAPFTLDAPFVVTQHGQNVGDVLRMESIYNEPVADINKSAHSLSGKINSSFTQQRSEQLLTITRSGNQNNPVYKLDRAPLVDPMETMARSSAGIAKSRFFEDYKHSEVENWVAQFADMIDASPAEVRADPMRFIQDPKWRDAQDNMKLAAAKNSRRAILSLLQVDHDFIKAFKWSRQKIMDEVYKTTGSKGVKIIDPVMWNSRTDPISMMRSITFHAYLGLLNVVQFPLQAASVVHAIAIDGNPIRAIQSVFGYWALRSRGLMESNSRAQGLLMKNVGKALGLSPDLLEEAYQTWKRTGMHIIEGEYSRLDDYLNPKMLFGRNPVLDVGTTFFKEGNNMHRGTSFMLAFLRHRAMNPEGKIGAKELRQIVDRADLGYVSMTRASNNAMQNGGKWWQQAASVPTQFFAYQARLTEQMLGKQLTNAEKARVMLVYSALWGVPTGVAGSTLGAFWPAHDAIRQYALEQGWDIDDNKVNEFLMEGAGSMAVEALTGTEFDVSGRLGPGGLSWLRDTLDGNWNEVLGASPNFVSNALGISEPFLRSIHAVFGDDETEFPLTEADFIDALRTVSSVNSAVRAYQVYNSGEWLTKTEGLTGKVPDHDVKIALAAALGLTPTDIADTYLKLRSNTQSAQYKGQVNKEVLLNFKRGLKAASTGNREQTLAFFKRAKALMVSGGFTPIEQQDLFRRAMKENKSLMQTVNTQFMLNDPQLRREEFIRSMQTQFGKEE